MVMVRTVVVVVVVTRAVVPRMNVLMNCFEVFLWKEGGWEKKDDEVVDY